MSRKQNKDHKVQEPDDIADPALNPPDPTGQLDLRDDGPQDNGAQSAQPKKTRTRSEAFYLVNGIRADGMPEEIKRCQTVGRARKYLFENVLLFKRIYKRVELYRCKLVAVQE